MIEFQESFGAKFIPFDNLCNCIPRLNHVGGGDIVVVATRWQGFGKRNR